MAAHDFDPDPPACPLLGLALDPRTHHTFPHPEHRCHASRSPSPVGPQYQAAHCLRLEFLGCGRYRAWEATQIGAVDDA